MLSHDTDTIQHTLLSKGLELFCEYPGELIVNMSFQDDKLIVTTENNVYQVDEKGRKKLNE